MADRLVDKVAIVTGAGSGIGRAISLAFAREGARVLAIDRYAEGLAETVGLADRPVLTLKGDVTDPQLPGSLRSALQTLGPLDILVNNAGIGGGGNVEDTSDDDLRRYLEVNVVGLFRLSRFAVEEMKPQRRGAILNLASVYAVMGASNSAGYSASKGAVASFTRQLATDYGPHGIRVNALGPGLIETPLTAERIRTQAWRRRIAIDQTPLRRVGQPDDVAAAAVFLCSDEAGFITGELLKVDGGWDMAGYPREPGT
ncbi:MAG: glucose 1-dehydrogenase [Phreatobacter sp.]|nr:glucose 1-dehydrogenase [Phreatobacter sp.]